MNISFYLLSISKRSSIHDICTRSVFANTDDMHTQNRTLSKNLMLKIQERKVQLDSIRQGAV